MTVDGEKGVAPSLLELKRLGGAASALKILHGASRGRGSDADIVARSTALVLAACATDAENAQEIARCAEWREVVAVAFAAAAGGGESVAPAVLGPVQEALADCLVNLSHHRKPCASVCEILAQADVGEPSALASLALYVGSRIAALEDDSAAYSPLLRTTEAVGALAASAPFDGVEGEGSEVAFSKACLESGLLEQLVAMLRRVWSAGREDRRSPPLGALGAAACHSVADVVLGSPAAGRALAASSTIDLLLPHFVDAASAAADTARVDAAEAAARVMAAIWASALPEAAKALQPQAPAVLDAAAALMASENAAMQDAGCTIVTTLLSRMAGDEKLRAVASLRAFRQKTLQGSETLLPLAWLLDSRDTSIQRRAARVFSLMRRQRDNDLMVSLVEQGAVPAIHALARDTGRKESPGRDAAKDAFAYLKDELRGAFLSLLLRSLDMEGNHKRRGNVAVAFVHVASTSRDVCLEFAGAESPSPALVAVAAMATQEGRSGHDAAVPVFRALLPLARSLAPRSRGGGAGLAMDAIDEEAARHEDLFNNRAGSDLTLVVGRNSTELFAQKAVLRAASPGFTRVVERAEAENLESAIAPQDLALPGGAVLTLGCPPSPPPPAPDPRSSIRMAEDLDPAAVLLVVRFAYRPAWKDVQEFAAAEGSDLGVLLAPMLLLASELDMARLEDAVAAELIGRLGSGDWAASCCSAAALDAAAEVQRFDVVEAILARLAAGAEAVSTLAGHDAEAQQAAAMAIARGMFVVLNAAHAGEPGGAAGGERV